MSELPTRPVGLRVHLAHATVQATADEGKADILRIKESANVALYVVPENVAWIDGTDFDMGEELYLTTVPDGQSVLLTGSARLIWLVAADGDDVVPGVADVVGIQPEEIATDVERFLEDLVSRGLLARRILG